MIRVRSPLISSSRVKTKNTQLFHTNRVHDNISGQHRWMNTTSASSSSSSSSSSSKGDVCVTGGRGLVGSHIVKALLSDGYDVRLTVRDPDNKKALKHIAEMQEQHPDRTIRVFYADLLADGSFEPALQGCTHVIHTASPFFHRTDNPQIDLVLPAVKGTLNVMHTAANTKVKRVVVTSSTAAMFHPKSDHRSHGRYTEADWNKESGQEDFPYFLSKVQGERTAWNVVEEYQQNSTGSSSPTMELAVVNPGLVLGPLLSRDVDNNFPTSIDTVRRIITGEAGSGKSLTAGGGGVAMVDARDVAQAHVRAMTEPSAAGKRFLCVNDTVTWRTMVETLRKIRPDTKTSPEQVPEVPIEDCPRFDTSRIQDVLGMNEFISLENSLKDMVDSLVERKVLPPM